jgi:hypothetical protein
MQVYNNIKGDMFQTVSMAGVIRAACEAQSVYPGPKLDEGHAGRAMVLLCYLREREFTISKREMAGLIGTIG